MYTYHSDISTDSLSKWTGPEHKSCQESEQWKWNIDANGWLCVLISLGKDSVYQDGGAEIDVFL